MINPELRDIITPELMDDEELLWAGRPQKHPGLLGGIWMFAFHVVWLVIIGIFFLGIFFSWLFPGELDNDEISGGFVIFMSTILVFFLLVGILGLYRSFRFLFGAKKCVYALTNRRGLIIDRFMRSRKLSIGKNALSIFQREDQKTFAHIYFGANSLDTKKWPGSIVDMPLSAIFFHIEYPDQVESLILENFYLQGPS